MASRTVTAADVIGPSGQGVAAGEFEEVLTAMRAGVAYANVLPPGTPEERSGDRSGVPKGTTNDRSRESLTTPPLLPGGGGRRNIG